jgi:hypothetical protein
MGLIVLDTEVPLTRGQGLPDERVLVSTPDAFPTGLESPWEYNGLILNDRSTVDKITILKIDGLADADVRDSREVNPSSDGETPGLALYGGRTVVLSGRVQAVTINKLRDMQQAIREAFADLSTERPLICKTDRVARDAYIYCRKSQAIAWSEEWNHGQRFYRDYMVTLRASDPRWQSFLSSLVQYEISGASDLSDGVVVGSAFNNGNYFALPKIRLTGPMTTPKLVNTNTGEFLEFTTTIPDGETWEIDVFTKTIEDLDGNNKFKYLSVNSTMWALDPESTIVEFYSPSVDDGAHISIQYRSAWI